MPKKEPIAADLPSLDEDSDRYEARTRDVLYLLTKTEDPQPVWSVEDLERAMEVDDVMPYVHELLGAGLAYRTADGFVFASRAGYRAVQVIGQFV